MFIAKLLNSLPDVDAGAVLTNCCGATAFVDGMLRRRPFVDDAAVMAAVDQTAGRMAEADWLEAFAAHPMIGDMESLRKKYAATSETAAGEQVGVAGAEEATLHELARLNREYRDKFGFIFIVFATGKSAAEMLAVLKSRIDNAREREIQNAAAEQLKITKLRLEKLAAAAGDA